MIRFDKSPEVQSGKPLLMTLSELNAHHEYSLTMPTGTTDYKVWVRDANARQFRMSRRAAPEPNWVRGRYVPTDDPDRVGIEWRPIVVAEQAVADLLFGWLGMEKG